MCITDGDVMVKEGRQELLLVGFWYGDERAEVGVAVQRRILRRQ